MGINKVKICGIHHTQNINSIVLLNPDFIGVIFYPYSLRFIGISFPIEPLSKKVGVFVNHTLEKIIKKRRKYAIDFVQLHGDESIEFCEELYKNNVSIIKVILVNEAEAFYVIQKYTNYSLYFLFDNYCKKYGGSGIKFSWETLAEYDFDTNFFLSGGIGLKDVETIKNVFHTKFIGIDLNSKFEIEPGNKNRDELKRFLHKINL